MNASSRRPHGSPGGSWRVIAPIPWATTAQIETGIATANHTTPTTSATVITRAMPVNPMSAAALIMAPGPYPAA